MTLTAEAAQYWEFVGWGGDLAGSMNPVTLTMTAGRTVTATFEVRPEGLPNKGYVPVIVGRPLAH